MTPALKTALAFLLATTCLFASDANFHGNLARTGVYEGAGPKSLAGVKWTVKTGGPIVASPVLADGVVYIGSLDGYLYALNEQDGKEKWKIRSRMPIASSAAVSGDTVYFVSSSGGLNAIDAATGKLKWTFATETEHRFEAKNLHGLLSAGETIPDAWDTYISSPAVFNGKVYFGSGDGNVYAVDAQSGSLAWKFATKDVVHASPAIAYNTVFIGSWDSNLYALDAETGQEKWAFKAGEDPAIHNQVGFQSSAAVADGVVYVGCRDGHLYAIDASTGRKRWDYSTSKSWVNSTPAVRDGVVYAATSDSSRFFALDAKTGRLRFNVSAHAFVFSSPALAGDAAYIGNHSGYVYAVDTKTGKIASQFQTEGSKADPLKMLNPDGSFRQSAFSPVFYDFQDMYITFYRFVQIGAIFSSPAVSNSVVFIGSMDGNVYALQ
jgi:outer membrane protein assembly factor BamB